jgi:DnaJ like chaperone protein
MIQIEYCRYHDDHDGRLVEARVSGAPRNALLVAHVLSAQGDAIQGRVDAYRDSKGNFVVVTELQQGHASFYIPWNALARSEANARLVLHAADAAAVEQSAEQCYAVSIPPTERYSKAEILGPLIGLAMAVAYADGVIKGSEVRCLKEVFVSGLGLENADIAQLKTLMRACPPTPLDPLARAALYRSQSGRPDSIITLLESVAIADGRITEDEISMIVSVAEVFDADLSFIRAIRDRAAQQPDDPWTVLGLAPGANEAEVKSAYRKLVAEYHPDRWMRAPPKLRDAANLETRRATAAYAAIQAGGAEEGAQPRPRDPARYSVYGVCESITWTDWHPIIREPSRIEPPPRQDPLAGKWVDAHGNGMAFVPDGDEYQVEDRGALGRVGSGRARRNGSQVLVTQQNYVTGMRSIALSLEGLVLRGSISVAGLPWPIALYRA